MIENFEEITKNNPQLSESKLNNSPPKGHEMSMASLYLAQTLIQ